MQWITKTILVSITGVGLLGARAALADPTEPSSNPPADAEGKQARAKVLMEATFQFIGENDAQRAYGAVNAAHRLQPTVTTACLSAVVSATLKLDVEAAERFQDCVRRAEEEELPKRDKKRWEVLVADYASVLSRVGVLRVKAPVLTELRVDEQAFGFADESRDIFVEPNKIHEIAASHVLGTMHARVNLRPGEQRTVYLILPETKAMEDVEAPVPLPPPAAPAPVFSPPLRAAPPVQQPAGFWISSTLGGVGLFGLVGFGAAALMSMSNARTAEERSNCDESNNENCRGTQKLFEQSSAIFGGLAIGSGVLGLLGTGLAIHFHIPTPSAASKTSANRLRSNQFTGFSLQARW